MKKKVSVLAVIMMLGLCSIQANAGTTYVSATLTEKVKSVSSGYALFDADRLYGNTSSRSKYSIRYTVYGRNNLNKGACYEEARATYNVGKGGTIKMKGKYNCHKITLTGKKSTGKDTKKCIGYGKVYEN